MKHKNCDAVKKLNYERHRTATKQEKLDGLMTEYNQMMKECDAAKKEKDLRKVHNDQQLDDEQVYFEVLFYLECLSRLF